MTIPTERPDMCRPATYMVRVEGVLSATCARRYESMNITIDRTPGRQARTTLTGILKDQAELVGLIMCLYNQGHEILYVQYLLTQSPPPGPSGPE
jgi:hypothetical protein